MKKLILFLVCTYGSISFGYINLYPLKFEKNITHGASENFVLYNRTLTPLKYRVYVESVEGKKSMANWVEVYPKSILIDPLKEEEIRLYVEAPKNTQSGEYQANLVIKEISLPSPQLEVKESKKKARVMTMVKLRLKGRVTNE